MKLARQFSMLAQRIIIAPPPPPPSTTTKRRTFGSSGINTRPRSRRPRTGFAAKLTVDSAFELIEAREANNTVAECLIVR